MNSTSEQPAENEKLKRIADSLHIGGYTRHVFLCIGNDCCTQEQGEAAWKALKDTLKEKNLSLTTGSTSCFRSKVQCLRVCNGGPILVVYPEGYWYGNMTEDRIAEFVERQIERGEPIEEWIFARAF